MSTNRYIEPHANPTKLDEEVDRSLGIVPRVFDAEGSMPLVNGRRELVTKARAATPLDLMRAGERASAARPVDAAAAAADLEALLNTPSAEMAPSVRAWLMANYPKKFAAAQARHAAARGGALPRHPAPPRAARKAPKASSVLTSAAFQAELKSVKADLAAFQRRHDARVGARGLGNR
jgi:hypothetical protein